MGTCAANHIFPLPEAPQSTLFPGTVVTMLSTIWKLKSGQRSEILLVM